MAHGREWIVDAFDCPPPRISGETGREALMSLFSNVIRASGLQPVGQAVWQFTGSTGAVTGMVALVESHLTCHSDPSAAYLALNLLSHRVDINPDWDGLLTRFVGARTIVVRSIERGPTAERRSGVEVGLPQAAPVAPGLAGAAAPAGVSPPAGVSGAAGLAERATAAPGPAQTAAAPH